MEPKAWWESKTIWVNLIMALAGVVAVFSPAVADVMKQYLGEAGIGWAIINIVLRLITSKEIA